MTLLVGVMMVGSAAAEEVFNGRNLDGWMVKPEHPPVWRVVKDKKGEPMIARQPGGSYLWTKQAFGDFVLEMEYKVSKGCNSGVFFRTDPDNPVQGGFEIQIFDSHGQEPTTHNTGALYDASPASSCATGGRAYAVAVTRVTVLHAVGAPMDARPANHAPVSRTPPVRYDLRQEPSAIIPPAGICAGAAGKPAVLPRPC